MTNLFSQIVCVVRCESGEALRAAAEIAERLNHPDTEVARTFVGFPGGREERIFRIGNYFDSIDLEQSEPVSPRSFSLIFRIKEGADSYWKAVLVAALKAVEERAPGVKASITPACARLRTGLFA